jgi:uncharacterized Ntn-hydrolase superfamily protein
VTFSIVACDLARGDWGVAVASKFPAVGAVVPWAVAGSGAVATQSYAKASFGPDGLALMGAGRSAEEALQSVLAPDVDRDRRQAGMVDSRGGAGTFTGSACQSWAGGRTGEGFACQGNILAGPQVVDEMIRAYEQTEGELVDRLLAALKAGDDAGGDRRGRQSAAVLVVRAAGGYGGETDRYVDLRVDDHAESVTELLRVFAVFDDEFLIRNDPRLEPTAELVSEVQRRLASMGRYSAEATGVLDEPTRRAVELFAGEVNLEEKVSWVDDRLSQAVIRALRELTPEFPVSR